MSAFSLPIRCHDGLDEPASEDALLLLTRDSAPGRRKIEAMRITILTVGSQGDAEPYVALGAGLQAAGHHVAIATHERFAPLVGGRGLDFRPVRGDPRQLLEEEAGRRWLETSSNPLRFVRGMLEAARPVIWQVADDLWQACQDTDLILYQVLTTFGATSISEKTGIPAFPAFLQHVHPTRAFSSPMAMPQPRFGRLYNRLTYPLGELIFWPVSRPLVNQWRAERLNLPPYRFGRPFHRFQRPGQPWLYGFSPYVIPKPREWGADVHVTGYWRLPPSNGWQPPAALLDFLAAGPPPVYVGFGSMNNRHPAEATEITLKALELCGRRGILLTGWGGLSDSDLPETVFKLDYVPHDWLFPRMAAVVHHGGMGTTAAGLRAGIPSIVVPFFSDQPFWAGRVTALGVGPRPIPRQKLTVEKLAAAICQATTDTAMQARAADLGLRLRAEDGVATAVSLVNRYLDQRSWVIGNYQ
ncbi:MAG: glycosyltransferase [Chloroflexota bacterium]